jgi:hypothetical protein
VRHSDVDIHPLEEAVADKGYHKAEALAAAPICE